MPKVLKPGLKSIPKQEKTPSASDIYREWERRGFKQKLVRQLVEKLTILPDQGTMDAVLQKAEYLVKGVYDER